MNHENLIARTEAILRDAETAAERFASKSGLKCPVSCGRCCESPFIEASALDCLPLAHRLLPQARTWLETLELAARSRPRRRSPCPFYVGFGAGKGLCSAYEARPLICRLYGFAAFRDDAGVERFDPCQPSTTRSGSS